MAARKPRFTPARAKNLLGIAKVVGPTVVPVVAPYALKAAGAVRNSYDRMRARRLGVEVDQLASYSGRGGALHARIAGVAGALPDLRAAGHAGFAEAAEHTLTQLAAAVRAAETMPTSRRKAAHRAVSAELDRVEEELLRLLGV
ncbi:DUF6474 family protein [Kutzneria viridogrisea]|uniref:Uncharacterized protein n=2 Tax=Kutzneria TaxID=43356 RepID=W5W5E4_9PSEU|nr:DUF6474 family protein [Kutzneria albida]AHH93429.1 hypothetical protein KALB_52 [Kutzneria albida DSM 43870]MBA8929186.1 hypothetical protein [Kutzneria viridogrisea]